MTLYLYHQEHVDHCAMVLGIVGYFSIKVNVADGADGADGEDPRMASVQRVLPFS